MTDKPDDNNVKKPPRILNIDEVIYRTDLARATIYRMVKRGDFPSARQVGPRRVGWLESTITKWILNLPKAKD